MQSVSSYASHTSQFFEHHRHELHEDEKLK
jgi:hypothetical protein